MAEERVEPKPIDLGEYKFGFHDDVEPVISVSYTHLTLPTTPYV